MNAAADVDSAGLAEPDPVSTIRARAAANARFLRALARTARNDGLPKADLRSANARRAARSVLDHARRMSSLCPQPSERAG